MNFTIGCDPELFLADQNRFISAIDRVGGSKKYPKPIGEGCAVQEDNVAVEFCIPPAKSLEAFRNAIRYSLDEISKRVPGLSFSHAASAVFPDEELMHPMAQEFGCDPDYNAWTGRKNPRPACDNPNLRSAGGHVHVGVDGVDKAQLIRAMDLHLGVPSIKIDQDKDRRKLYGNPGAFRPKPYGVEYRTLSNFWIWDDILIEWVYHQTSRAVSFVQNGGTLDNDDGVLIHAAIQNSDMNAYNTLRSQYGAF